MQLKTGRFIEIFKTAEINAMNRHNHMGFACANFVELFKGRFQAILREENGKELDLCIKVDGKGNPDYKDVLGPNGTSQVFQFKAADEKERQTWLSERNERLMDLDDVLIASIKLDKDKHRKYYAHQIGNASAFLLFNGILFEDNYYDLLKFIEEKDIPEQKPA